MVIEDDVRARLREEFYSGGSDAAGASGDQCSLACERNHFSPGIGYELKLDQS
jgi:hypothetical protein